MVYTIELIIWLIKNQRIKEFTIIYILITLGILFTVYGSILYSPALLNQNEYLSKDEVRMELMNNTKGAFIAQDFELVRYNIGYDMLNVGGIFFIIGTLVFNYILTKNRSNAYNGPRKTRSKNPSKVEYGLREKGFLKGNILEWSCFILFLFAFCTCVNNIFHYIIFSGIAIGIIGYAIRKLKLPHLKLSRSG